MNIKERMRSIKREVIALYFALHHPDTPWYAKGIILLVVAYALSPIDLIPDFIPVIGYLDDLIVLPLGIALAVKLIPAHVMQECRARADSFSGKRLRSYLGIAIVLVIWSVLGTIAAVAIVKLSR